ncbi:MAG: hypothetical protein H7839_15125 [Magnetococcus sp. YQC-5]
MNQVSSSLPDLPDQQLQAIVALKNTTFLWKSLIAPVDHKQFVCPIRHTTYERIKKDLATLCEAGFFEFNLLYSTSGQDQSVIEVEISEISDRFKEIIRLLFPEAQSHTLVATPVPVNQNRQVTTRPLTASVAAPVKSATRRIHRPSWLMLIVLLLGIESVHWIDWSQPLLESVAVLATDDPLWRNNLMQDWGLTKVPIPAESESMVTPASITIPVSSHSSSLATPPASPSRPAPTPPNETLFDISTYTPSVFPIDSARLPKEENPVDSTLLDASGLLDTVAEELLQSDVPMEPFWMQPLEFEDPNQLQCQHKNWLSVLEPVNNAEWVMPAATLNPEIRQRMRWLDSFVWVR